jgi:hypothetical protein
VEAAGVIGLGAFGREQTLNGSVEELKIAANSPDAVYQQVRPLPLKRNAAIDKPQVTYQSRSRRKR